MHLSRRDRLRDIEMDQFFDRTWDYEPPTWLERGYYPPHLPPYAERYNYPYFPQYGFNPLEEPGFDPRLPPHYPYLDPPPRDYFGFRPPDDFEGDLAEALQSPARDGLRPRGYRPPKSPRITYHERPRRSPSFYDPRRYKRTRKTSWTGNPPWR